MADIYYAGTQLEVQLQGLKSRLRDKAAAKRLLFSCADVLENIGADYAIAYGTLLGAMREGDFITHDTDIDIAVIGEESVAACRKAVAEGMFADRGISKVRGDVHMVQGDIYADLYDFLPDPTGEHLYGFKDLFLEDWYFPLGRIEFHSRTFPTFRDPVKYLETIYGDWKTVRERH